MDNVYVSSGALLLCFWGLLKWTVTDKLDSIKTSIEKLERRNDETTGRVQTLEVGHATHSGEIRGLSHRVRSLEQHRWASAPPASDLME